MSPRMQEIMRMTNEDLSRIENFVVGRLGYGQIEFPGSTDIRDLNLDNILQLSAATVFVGI